MENTKITKITKIASYIKSELFTCQPTTIDVEGIALKGLDNELSSAPVNGAIEIEGIVCRSPKGLCKMYIMEWNITYPIKDVSRIALRVQVQPAP